MEFCSNPVVWEQIPVPATSILELVPDFVGVADRDGRLMFINSAGRKMVGLDRDADLSGFRIHDFFPSWTVAALEPSENGNGNGAGGRLDWCPRGKLRTCDGRTIPAAHAVVAHTDEDSEISCFTLIARGAFWPEEDTASVQRVDIESLLRESLAVVRTAADPSVSIRESFESENAAVLADPTQIHQLVMNLCLDSAQSMRGGGGEIFVSTSRVAIKGPEEPGGTALKAGSYVRMTIRDDGPGIAPSVAPYVFDPVVANHRDSGFTGFGLWTVKRSVVDSGGDIFVETAPGRGTAFHVYLPIVGTNGSGSLL
jgi:signal transduction histidine kinase